MRSPAFFQPRVFIMAMQRLLQMLTAIVCCGSAFAATAMAETETGEPDFAQAIEPFLSTYCLHCHGGEIDEGDFRLDQLSADVAAGTDTEQWRQVMAKMRSGEMPPEDEAEQPTPAARQAVVDWLTSRLPNETTASSHWAYRPLEHARGSSVDEFVGRELRARGLAFSARAEPQRLLRRVYLDLIGLPPSPAESAAFASDPSGENFAKIVDDLLARPQYGERWGRHWLDLARYADSNGLHEDGDRPHAWRYRDYVIDSFNADKPYGRFILEQLAGDEIAPDDPQAWIATGFCRSGPSNDENIGKAELESYRLDQLDDILATTSQVFLAQTIGCARCHDHKFDPFTLSDYYRLLSVFDHSVAAYVPLADRGVGDPEVRPIRARAKKRPPQEPHVRALTDLNAQPPVTRVLLRGDPLYPGPEVSAGVPEVFSGIPVSFSVQPTEKTSGRRAALAQWIAAPENPLTWRVMANRVWQHHFGRGLVTTPSNFGKYGGRPSHPELLDWLACQLRDNGGRLKPLHRLIVLSRTYQQSSMHRDRAADIDPENESLWRYPPHRLEAEIIRDSILAASGNLNLKIGGPGIKPKVPVEILEQSKRNIWPNVKEEGSEHWRRSVYVYTKRQMPMPLLSLFDAPDTAQSCDKRFRSTTPTQSLALLNDEFVNDQAQHLASRLLAEDAEHAVENMLKEVWALPVSTQQFAEAQAFIAARREVYKPRKETDVLSMTDLGVVLFNSSQFVYID